MNPFEAHLVLKASEKQQNTSCQHVPTSFLFEILLDAPDVSGP